MRWPNWLRRLAAEGARPLGLYVHWPFCQSKCPNSDFNSHDSAEIDVDRWTRAYSSEIARVSQQTPDQILTTIYLGGGTPSLMPPSLVETIIDSARRAWRTANDVEITLEANPNSVEAGRFRDFRAAGVNRVSIGVQALDDASLKALGRLHSADEARQAVKIASDVFDRFSFDLIYARQNQSLADWRGELGQALDMAGGHLSLYQLTIEPGTAFADRYRKGGLRGLPDGDLSADMYALTQELTEAAGLPAYETSNHAAPGQESRHNLIYWHMDDYAGIGPGAHGRLQLGRNRVATEAHRAPNTWLEAAETAGSGDTLVEPLAAEQIAEERVMMGLRLRAGIPRDQIEALPGGLINQTAMDQMIDEGFLSFGDALATTKEGRPLLNAILGRLLA